MGMGYMKYGRFEHTDTQTPSRNPCDGVWVSSVLKSVH